MINIANIRLGHATNSSSSHSMVFFPMLHVMTLITVDLILDGKILF